MNIEAKNNLVKWGIIEDPFDYTNLDEDLVNKYEIFNNTFSELVKSYASAFKINHSFFYIKNNRFCNAFAKSYKGYNIIGITNGYVVKMSELFDDKYFNSIIAISLINNPQISNGYIDLHKLNNFSFNKFMLECCIHYTFNHEFQHILQFNSVSVKSIYYYFEENIIYNSFDQQKHVWEFDADRFGTYGVLKYIFQIKRKFNIINKNTFKCLLFMGLGGLFISKIIFYFGIVNLNNKIKIENFYTEKYTHPHPLVRIFNIIEYFYLSIQDDFKELNIEMQDLLNNSLGIVNIYLKSLYPEQQLIENLFLDIQRYLKQITEYNQKLFDFAIKDKSIVTLLEKRGINYK